MDEKSFSPSNFVKIEEDKSALPPKNNGLFLANEFRTFDEEGKNIDTIIYPSRHVIDPML